MNVQNDRKGSPLMFAAEFGHVECVRALLNAGAEIDAQDDDGTHACAVACMLWLSLVKYIWRFYATIV